MGIIHYIDCKFEYSADNITIMALYVFGLLTSLFIIDLTLSQWTTTGTSNSFIFTSNITQMFSIVWYFSSTNDKLFICEPGTVSCGPIRNATLDIYSANITSYLTNYTSIFTIKKVTPLQHNNVWLCRAELQNGSIFAQEYNLQVFSVPGSPACENVTLINEGKIKIHCMTKKVFPEGICVFYIKTNNTSLKELKDGEINYGQQQDNVTGYYKTNCTYTISANYVGPGTHTFQVVMYPAIPLNISDEMKRTSDPTMPITIGYPEAGLQPNCKVDDYVRENDTVNCTCYDNNINFLPSYVTWSTQDINNYTLNFIAKRGIGSYNCTISNNLNWTNTITFHPKVSYAPDTVNLTLNENKFNICNGTNVAISGICFVSESNPEPSVYININNTFEKLSSSTKTGDFIFNIIMESAGFFYVSCIANSTAFSNTFSKETKNFTIKGPPEKPIIFKDGQHDLNLWATYNLEVRNGDTITCQSKGGFPQSKNLSLTCGSEEAHAINQDHVDLKLNISHNITCDCTLGHESQCLQNRTTVQLQFSETLLDLGEDFKSIYIGAGVGVCCVVICITVIIIMIKTRIWELKWCARSMFEKLVNNEEIYFIKKEKSSTLTSLYQDYTNVVTTMTSARELPKNLAKIG